MGLCDVDYYADATVALRDNAPPSSYHEIRDNMGVSLGETYCQSLESDVVLVVRNHVAIECMYTVMMLR